jgi:hypothetical protein
MTAAQLVQLVRLHCQRSSTDRIAAGQVYVIGQAHGSSRAGAAGEAYVHWQMVLQQDASLCDSASYSSAAAAVHM